MDKRRSVHFVCAKREARGKACSGKGKNPQKSPEATRKKGGKRKPPPRKRGLEQISISTAPDQKKTGNEMGIA